MAALLEGAQWWATATLPEAEALLAVRDRPVKLPWRRGFVALSLLHLRRVLLRLLLALLALAAEALRAGGTLVAAWLLAQLPWRVCSVTLAPAKSALPRLVQGSALRA